MRPRRSEASTIWSTIYANRSNQDELHLPNQIERCKMGTEHRLRSTSCSVRCSREPVFAVRLSPWYNCELFVVRSDQSQVRSGGHFHLLRLAKCAFKEPSIRCRPAVIYYARNRANPSAHPASTAPSGPSMKFCQLGSVLQEVGLKRCWRGPKSCCVKVVRLKGKYVRSPANRPPSRAAHPVVNIRTSEHPNITSPRARA